VQREIFKGAGPRVFILGESGGGGNSSVFVLAKGLWCERVEGQAGAVEFPRVADDEESLREQVAPLDEEFDLKELDGDSADEVRRSLLEQAPLYPEAPELSDQWEE
jgi:hypothetical protein